jgi:Ca2+/H+ antiporter
MDFGDVLIVIFIFAVAAFALPTFLDAIQGVSAGETLQPFLVVIGVAVVAVIAIYPIHEALKGNF